MDNKVLNKVENLQYDCNNYKLYVDLLGLH